MTFSTDKLYRLLAVRHAEMGDGSEIYLDADHHCFSECLSCSLPGYTEPRVFATQINVKELDQILLRYREDMAAHIMSDDGRLQRFYNVTVSCPDFVI